MTDPKHAHAPSTLEAERPPLRLEDVGVVGVEVRARRRQLRLTQVQAAALSGVGTRFLSELERGKATVELGKVLRVLSSLGLDLWLAPRRARSHLDAIKLAGPPSTPITKAQRDHEHT